MCPAVWDKGRESEQRSGLGLERGRRKAEGPPWCHQGTCGAQKGHREGVGR